MRAEGEAAPPNTVLRKGDRHNPKRRRPDGSTEPEITIDPKAVLEGMKQFDEIADIVERALASGEATARVYEDGGVREVRASGGDAPTTGGPAAPRGPAAPNAPKRERRKFTPPSTEAEQRALFERVAPFVDPNLQSPIFAHEVRGKLFIGTVPEQNRLLDVARVVGIMPGGYPTVVQVRESIIGELMVAMAGWVPAKSAAVGMIRQNLADRTKWVGHMREITWGRVRDPFVYDDEIEPLWDAYTKWYDSVVPLREEIAFYYASMQ